MPSNSIDQPSETRKELWSAVAPIGAVVLAFLYISGYALAVLGDTSPSPAGLSIARDRAIILGIIFFYFMIPQLIVSVAAFRSGIKRDGFISFFKLFCLMGITSGLSLFFFQFICGSPNYSIWQNYFGLELRCSLIALGVWWLSGRIWNPVHLDKGLVRATLAIGLPVELLSTLISFGLLVVPMLPASYGGSVGIPCQIAIKDKGLHNCMMVRESEDSYIVHDLDVNISIYPKTEVTSIDFGNFVDKERIALVYYDNVIFLHERNWWEVMLLMPAHQKANEISSPVPRVN